MKSFKVQQGSKLEQPSGFPFRLLSMLTVSSLDLISVYLKNTHVDILRVLHMLEKWSKSFETGEKLQSNLSRFVVTVWIFVVLVLTSSYTAMLSSVLTVQQITSNRGSFELQLISSIVLNGSEGLKSPADYVNLLRNGKLDAITDEIMYIKSIPALYSGSEFSLVATQTNTNGFGFVSII